MGTSSLYKGPKKTVLLPDDYSDESVISDSSSVQEETTQSNEEDTNKQEHKPSVTWRSARNNISKSASRNNGGYLKRAVSSYTKALGGYKNAAKLSAPARIATSNIISFFSGTPSEIRERFEKVGISFENKTTKDVFLEICDVIAPTPNTIDEGYVNSAVIDAFSELVKDESIMSEDIESVLNEAILQKLVCGTIKYYIYTKLIAQATLGVLKNKSIEEVQIFEKNAKLLIEGIVSAVVPDMLKSGIKETDISSKVSEIFEGCYKVMEEMKI